MDAIQNFKTLYSELCDITPDDLPKVYSDDVTFIDPVCSHEGIKAVQKYFDGLLTNASSCKFDIHEVISCSDASITHVVNWTMHLKFKKSSKLILLNGTSQLKVTGDKISYHKDYYDLGEMVYEHIPVLGFIVKKIKAKLAK